MSYSDSEAVTIMHELGCGNVQYSGSVLKSNCPLCPPTTKKSKCFVVMLTSAGPTSYFCHRCKSKGRLHHLVWGAWFAGRRPRKAMTIVMAYEQEYLCGEKPKAKVSDLSYVPLADKPALAKEWKDLPRAPLYGNQLELSPAPEKHPEVVVKETDIAKFQKGDHPYLTSRCFSSDTQSAYEVRKNTWGKRVVFPIRDWEGALRGYSQRRAYNGPNCPKCDREIGCGKDMKYKCECGALHAKYLHSKGFRRNSVLYGEWLYEDGCVPVVVEGMTDAHNLYQKGLRPPFALPLGVMGGSAAESQIRRILEKFPGKTIYVARDHDDPDKYPELPDGKAPGDIMAETLEATVKMLSPDTEVVHFIPNRGQDPGDLSETQVFWMKLAIEDGMKGELLV